MESKNNIHKPNSRPKRKVSSVERILSHLSWGGQSEGRASISAKRSIGSTKVEGYQNRTQDGSSQTVPESNALDSNENKNEKKTRLSFNSKHYDPNDSWGQPSDSEEVLYNEKNEISAATITKLVELLCLEPEPTRTQNQQAFLMTHFSFISSVGLFELITQRYFVPLETAKEVELSDRFRLGAAALLSLWVLEYFEDFLDHELFKKFVEFCKHLSDTDKSGKQILEAKKRLELKLNVHVPTIPPTRMPTNSVMTFENLSAEDIAIQLTLLEYKLLAAIRRREFLNQSYNLIKDKASPNIVTMTNWFQQTSDWVSTQIAKEPRIKERIETIIKFVDIGMKLLELKNFFGVMEIISGLYSPAIAVLKYWQRVPKSTKKKLEKITSAMNPKCNFKHYRMTLRHFKQSSEICIPYIPVFLTILTFLDYINPNLPDPNWINFEKVLLISKKIKSFYKCFEGKEYRNLSANSAIQSYLLGVAILPFEQLPLESIPPERHNPSIEGVTIVQASEYGSLGHLSGTRRGISTEYTGVTDEDMQKLLSASSMQKYEAGAVLMKQGVYNKKLFRIKSGEVKIMKSLHGPKGPATVTLATMGPGSLLGEMSVLNYGVTSASVVAAEELEVQEMEMLSVFKLFKQDPNLSSRFYKSLAQSLVHRLRALPPPKSTNSKKLQATESLRSLKFTRRFDLPETEVLIKEYYCSMGRKRGKMYISRNYVCFVHKFFVQIKEKIELHSIRSIEMQSDALVLTTDQQKCYFKNFKEPMSDCYNIISRAIKDAREREVDDRNPQDNSAENEDESYVLTQMDWDLIRKGAKEQMYNEDEIIIEEGQSYQKVFHINKGSCKVVKRNASSGELVLLGVMCEEETFGEMSFLDGEPASASVIAAEDVELHVIEGEFINVLFQVRPDIAGKFFRYLATVLAERLKQREAKSIEVPEEDSHISLSSFLGEMERKNNIKGRLQKRGTAIGSSWKTRYCEVHDGMMIVYQTDEIVNQKSDTKGAKRIIPLAGVSVRILSVQLFQFKIMTSKWGRLFGADSVDDMKEWLSVLAYWTEPKNRFDSYVPVRTNINAKWYIDGKDTFEAIADVLESAKETIFLTDWFLVPELYLRRTHPTSISNRLDKILRKKAQEGVRIYVLVWNETSIAVKLNSAATKKKLEALHENILVIRHPPLEPLNWSHHQKTVVVDNEIAFVGGLDLCYGRWDTQEHACVDNCHLSIKWPGKDYINPHKKPIDHPEIPFREHIDRSTTPRMGWHDIAIRVDGDAARDVAYNFIQRWNHHKDFIGETSYPYLLPKAAVVNPPNGSCNCQLMRSISEWSGATSTENSIAQAYIDCIRTAEHFIYIENQYFISSLAGGGIENPVAEEILKRIIRAIEEEQIFRVFVIIPVIPDGIVGENAGTRYIMKWQYDTICRGGNSIIENLKLQYPDLDPSDFITFHALRSYGELEGSLVTEQIYVHAKMMIVDDRRVIVGSANINDRSFRGDRDSEISCLVEDQDLVPSTMNGGQFMASKFARDLRIHLWAEHLGLRMDPGDSLTYDLLQDPVAEATYKYWKTVAENNTKIFNSLFPDIPQDDITLLSEWNATHTRVQADGIHRTGNNLVSGLKGHLINFPLGFLSRETLSPEFVDIKIRAVDRAIFQ